MILFYTKMTGKIFVILNKKRLLSDSSTPRYECNMTLCAVTENPKDRGRRDSRQ